jgi:hypothetical protein
MYSVLHAGFLFGCSSTLNMEVICSPKRWFTFGLHGPTFQKMAKFKTTAVRDSNSTPNLIGQRSPLIKILSVFIES